MARSLSWCVVVVVYKFMRGRLPVVVRALFILELHRCQPAACERVFSRSSTHHIRTYIHTQLLEYVKGLKDILEEKQAKITGLLS